jgi:hypothetical protein
MPAYLWRVSRKVVGSELVSSDMGIQLLEPAIVDGEDRELPALGIVDVEIDLAVLAVVGWHGTGTNFCDILVIDQSEDVLCSIGCVGHRAGWAARTSKGKGFDEDIIRVGTAPSLCCWCSKGESRSSEKEERAEVHFDLRAYL